MRTAIFLLLACLAGPALAAEPPYLDDRSGPEALVRSLYNAINRREYARAYSYFSQPPSPTPEAYADGYKDTESVMLRLGAAGAEGAAGTVHYTLPVAIRADSRDGGSQVYAGCYELSRPNAQLSPTGFTPLRIDRGRLRASTETIESALPERCGDGPVAEPGAALQARATEMFLGGPARSCDIDEAMLGTEGYVDAYPFEYRYSHSGADEPPSRATLFRFLCRRGAYNEGHVFILADSSGELELVSVTTPELDIRYVGNDSDNAVESISITGYTASIEVPNSDFDSKTLTLSGWAKWRGLGDASSSTTWVFRNGKFALRRFDADASYNGEIDPETIVDFGDGGSGTR